MRHRSLYKDLCRSGIRDMSATQVRHCDSSGGEGPDAIKPPLRVGFMATYHPPRRGLLGKRSGVRTPDGGAIQNRQGATLASVR